MTLVIKMKQAKKTKKQTKTNNSFFSSDNEMAKLILLVVIVALAFAIFYIITLFVIKKDDTKTPEEETKEVTIQYEKILIGNILNQKENEYYVLVYKDKDQYVDLYKGYLSYYQSKEESVPYYFAELDNIFNKDFYAEKSNLDVEDFKQIKFSQTTLLRIKDGKVISTYEGKDNITGKLSRMTK